MRRLYGVLVLVFLPLLLSPSAAAQWNLLNPVRSFQKDAKGLTLRLERGALRFQVCNDSVLRVLYAPAQEFPTVAEYVVIKNDWPVTEFSVGESANEVTLATAKVKLVIAKKDSSFVFYDAA